MRRPNFFIVGAPKCGTTSLAAWLSAHSRVYMSPVKEPHYFDIDIHRQQAVRESCAYEKLFHNASDEHVAVGEASANYIFSEVAISRILEYAPDARFIALVRNPIEMAAALHEQRRYGGYEDEADFETAWRLSGERSRGFRLPRGCLEPKLCDYHSRTKLGAQVDRLLQCAGSDRCLVLVLDDMRADPKGQYRRVLNFLNLPDDGRNSFPVHNKAKEHRSQAIARLFHWAARVRSVLNIYQTPHLLKNISGLNRRERPREPLPEAFRNELASFFGDDILLLSSLLNRDLSYWLQTPDMDCNRVNGEPVLSDEWRVK